MKSKTFKLLISVILLLATLQPMIYAPYDTASPSASNDDAMMTTLGNYFGDTHYLALQDETVDMVTGIRFNGVGVPQGAKINNATLFVYNVYDHGVGLASCTLAGDDADNSMAFNDSSSFNRVYTLEFVIWNTSDIRSAGLHNVSITEIVQEIVDRPGWSSGNSLSLIMFSESGSPRREFTSEDSFYTTPYIAIWYDEEPTDQDAADIQDDAETPYNETDEYVWEYNGTYRGIDIWRVTQISLWLNFSTFTVWGSDAGRISGLNDTYFHVNQIRSQHNVYMQRNFTDDGTGMYGVKFGIEFQDLQASGGGYDWYGIWGISDTNVSRINDWNDGYAFAGRTYDEVDDIHRGTAWDIESGAIGDSGAWFYSTEFLDSGMPYTLWFDIHLDMEFGFYNVSTYNDVAMTDLNTTWNYAFDDFYPPYSPGAFLYETLVNSWDNLVSTHGYTGNYRSGFGIEDMDSVIFIVYPNGTLVTPDPLPDGVDPEDAIDDLLGGAQPEDPELEEYGAIGKFQWKLLVMAVGFVMLLGSPMAGIYLGASGSTWIKLVFVMCFGLAILSQLKFM